jgi:hypothetical protein
VSTLQNWATVLAARGITTSGLVSSDAGHHLNFRAPCDIPIELFVIDERVMASLGLAADEPYALSHR